MSIQQILLGSGGATEETYWITIVGDDSPALDINSVDTIAVHTDGSVYSGCYCSDGSNSDWKSYLVKLDKAGAVSWQRTVDNDGRSGDASGCQVDNAGDVYQCGQKNISDGDGQWLHKFNSSGTIQWQRRLYGDKHEAARDIVVDSSDNVYTVSEQELSSESGKQQGLIAKYNSSGTLQWQKRMYWILSSKQFREQYKAAIDSNDDIYVVGSLYGSGYYERGCLLKMDDGGTEDWIRTQAISGGNLRSRGCAVDSSDNVIVSSYHESGGVYTQYIIKYDSSANLVWKRKIGHGTSDSFTRCNIIQGLAVDTDDSVYGIGACSGTGTGDWVWVGKWNSSGTLQWQNRIRKERNDDWASVTSFGVEGTSIATLGNHSFYLVMRVGSTGSAYHECLAVLKLPADGTLTGSHGDFDIIATTFTEAADTSLTTNGGESLGITTSSITENTPSYTVANVSYTSLKTDVD